MEGRRGSPKCISAPERPWPLSRPMISVRTRPEGGYLEHISSHVPATCLPDCLHLFHIDLSRWPSQQSGLSRFSWAFGPPHEQLAQNRSLVICSLNIGQPLYKKVLPVWGGGWKPLPKWFEVNFFKVIFLTSRPQSTCLTEEGGGQKLSGQFPSVWDIFFCCKRASIMSL